jgi:hypothetical protein
MIFTLHGKHLCISHLTVPSHPMTGYPRLARDGKIRGMPPPKPNRRTHTHCHHLYTSPVSTYQGRAQRGWIKVTGADVFEYLNGFKNPKKGEKGNSTQFSVL